MPGTGGRLRGRAATACLLAAGMVCVPAAARAQSYEITPIAVADPFGVEQPFRGFRGYGINSRGEVAFGASLSPPADAPDALSGEGIYVGRGGETGLADYTTLLERPPEVTPAPGLKFFTVGALRGSRAAFGATDSTVGEHGLFSTDGTGVRTLYLDPDPGNALAVPRGSPSLNGAGTTAFVEERASATGPDPQSLIASRGEGDPTVLYRTQPDTFEDPSRPLRSFRALTPVINDAGEVLFGANVYTEPGGTQTRSGLFRGRGGDAFTTIVTERPTAGEERFALRPGADMNDDGTVAFIGETFSADATERYESLLTGDGGEPRTVLRGSNLLSDPRLPGTFRTFDGVAVNDAGDLAFTARYWGAGGELQNGLFYVPAGGTQAGIPVRIASTGDAFGESEIQALSFSREAFNDSGEIAFHVTAFSLSPAGAIVPGSIARAVARASPTLRRWASAADGAFAADPNWSPRGVPGAGQHAVFDPDGTYTVSFAEDARSDTVSVSAGEVTFDLAGSRYSVDALEIRGAPGSPASLEVPVAGAHRSGVRTPEVLVSGAGRLSTNGALYVGDVELPVTGMDGVDVLTDIHAGRRVRVEGGATLASGLGWVNGPGAGGGEPALVEIDGDGSAWLAVGSLRVGHQPGGAAATPGEIDSSGRIRVTHGGQLSSRLEILVDAPAALAPSRIEVRGRAAGAPDRGSQLTAPRLVVGQRGGGLLQAGGGAEIGVDLLIIGDRGASPDGLFGPAGGEVVLEGEGTRLAALNVIEPTLVVGNRGGGVLTVRDGASVRGLLSVGVANAGDGATGVARIEGRGAGVPEAQQTALHAPSIDVAPGDGSLPGRGELHVSGGARVAATAVSVATGSAAGGSGLLSLSGAGTTLSVDFGIDVGGASPGTLSVTGGALVDMPLGVLTVADHGTTEIRDAARLVAGGVNIHPGGTLVGDDGTLVVAAGESLISNRGTLRIGASPGRFSIDGDYRQGAEGLLEIEIAGPTAGTQYDQLLVDGDVELGGTVLFSFLDGFAPAPDEIFEFVLATGSAELSGARFDVRGLAPGFEFEVGVSGGALGLNVLGGGRPAGRPVPEPPAWLLLLPAWAALARRARRRAAGGRLQSLPRPNKLH